MEKETKILIKCPKCGYEYLPCEIFFPDDFLGTATNVVRDEDGKIIYFDGSNMNLKENFVCDKCGCSFDVEASISFKVKEDKEDNSFDDE